MKIEIRNRLDIPRSYRVDRALGLFNVSNQQAAEYYFDVEVPIESPDWRIGVIVGPSGSGKTSIGRALGEAGWLEWGTEPWTSAAILDDIAPEGSFENVTGVLASVGLGTVPSWLRPFGVLSNGEKYRAELARLLAEEWRDQVWFDEFTSTLDRKVATIGAQAFAKAWRRGPARRAIFLTPHEDVIPWLKPDWTISTSLQGVALTTEGDEPRASAVSRAADYDKAPIAEVIA